MVFKWLYALTGIVRFRVARCAGAGPSARVCVPWTGRTGGGAWGVTKSPRLTWKTLWGVRNTWEIKMTSYNLSIRSIFQIEMEKHALVGSAPSPSIRMFFRSIGLTALEPSVTPVVLQYRILEPDFRFTWSYEENII